MVEPINTCLSVNKLTFSGTAYKQDYVGTINDRSSVGLEFATYFCQIYNNSSQIYWLIFCCQN